MLYYAAQYSVASEEMSGVSEVFKTVHITERTFQTKVTELQTSV
jgi:hypothetical protein